MLQQPNFLNYPTFHYIKTINNNIKQTIMEKLDYIPPTLEIIEIVVEKGFANSMPIDKWTPKFF